MTLRPKLQKLSNFELKFRNIPQNLAKILPNFISGPKMVHFYSKKCIFRWGLKRAPPRYTSVEKYAGTDRVKLRSHTVTMKPYVNEVTLRGQKPTLKGC